MDRSRDINKLVKVKMTIISLIFRELGEDLKFIIRGLKKVEIILATSSLNSARIVSKVLE